MNMKKVLAIMLLALLALFVIGWVLAFILPILKFLLVAVIIAAIVYLLLKDNKKRTDN